ncbi:SPFH domain-containing protein [Modestobacter lapidis]|nr:SPFH domain-containing protein [Modestobacter lapidis]
MKIYDVIKNESGNLNGGLGTKKLLVWKFTGEDFNDNSQLIVSESEEAVFVRDGVAVAVFTGGRYTLNTNNHPFIGSIRRRLTGGVSPFSAQVYFVSKDHKLGLFWGTDTPIQMRDPVLRLQTSIQARGSYSVQVHDSKKFLVKLVGSNLQLLSEADLGSYFRSAFLQHVKDAIAQHIKDSGQEILEVCVEKTAIARSITERLTPIADDYGIRLVDFYLESVDIPESDPNRGKLEEAFADKGVMGILGADWGRQQSAGILRDLANNPGAGGVAATGAGVGLGLAAGNVFGDMSTRMFAQPLDPPAPPAATFAGPSRASRYAERPAESATVPCPGCGADNAPTAKFCMECGAQQPAAVRGCTGCGAPVAAAARFCPECGTPQHVAAEG